MIVHHGQVFAFIQEKLELISKRNNNNILPLGFPNPIIEHAAKNAGD